VKELYQLGLVHGDLSAHNILVQKGKAVFIDFSQTTATDSPNAKELMLRDLSVISTFFKKYGIKTEPEELLKEIIRT